MSTRALELVVFVLLMLLMVAAMQRVAVELERLAP